MESILSMAFVVPCIPPDQAARIGSRAMAPAQSLEMLESSQYYYVALPPCTQCKNIGWVRKLMIE
jgi:hypothetical protein